MFTKRYPDVGVVIPFGGNRAKNGETLYKTIVNILNQNYEGKITVYVVADLYSNVASAVLGQVLSSSEYDRQYGRLVKLVDFVRPKNVVGRDTISRYFAGWKEACLDGNEILSVTGTSIIFPYRVVDYAVSLIKSIGKSGAIDGVTRRPQNDNCFVSLFQDNALIREFPDYDYEGLVLTTGNFGKTKHIPTLTSFFMTVDFYDQHVMPLKNIFNGTNGLDDFTFVYHVLENGGKIHCFNSLFTYRGHKVGFRWLKHFTSGFATYEFFNKNPETSYAKVRSKQAIVFLTALLINIALFLIFMISGSWVLFLATAGINTMSLLFLGLINFVKTKLWQAFLFPLPMLLLVAVWVFGFYYAHTTGAKKESKLLQYAHMYR